MASPVQQMAWVCVSTVLVCSLVAPVYSKSLDKDQSGLVEDLRKVDSSIQKLLSDYNAMAAKEMMQKQTPEPPNFPEYVKELDGIDEESAAAMKQFLNNNAKAAKEMMQKQTPEPPNFPEYVKELDGLDEESDAAMKTFLSNNARAAKGMMQKQTPEPPNFPEYVKELDGIDGETENEARELSLLERLVSYLQNEE